MKLIDPLTWRLSGERCLFVDAGRVACPIRGDVDQEECFACGRMLRFQDGEQPAVICGVVQAGSMLGLGEREAC